MLGTLKSKHAGAEMTGTGRKGEKKHVKKGRLRTPQLGWKALAWCPRTGDTLCAKHRRQRPTGKSEIPERKAIHIQRDPVTLPENILRGDGSQMATG